MCSQIGMKKHTVSEDEVNILVNQGLGVSEGGRERTASCCRENGTEAASS